MVIFGEHDAIRCDDIQVGRMSSGKDLSVIDLIVQVGACVCVLCKRGALGYADKSRTVRGGRHDQG